MANTKKKTTGKDLGIKIFLSLTAILLVVVICTSVLGSTGLLLRSSAALSSANFEVDGAMLTYFYRTSYHSLVSSMGDSISYFLDTSKPLKSQTFIDGEQTWHEYLIASATSQAKQLLVLAEAAKAAGMSLDEDDMTSLEDNMKSLETTAATYNYPNIDSFIAAQYGEGMKAKDIRRAIELTLLAAKYSEKMTNDIVLTADEINAYFTEHEADYTSVDLRQFTFSAGSAAEMDGITDADKEQMKKDLRAHADELAKCTTPVAFDAYLTKYMKEQTAAVNGEITEENIDSVLESAIYDRYTSRDTDQGKWAFEAGRKAGDTTVIEVTDSIGFTVVLLVNPASRDESATRNVRHILLQTENHTDAAGAKAEAEKVLAEFEGGAKTEDAFAALANKYSEDPGSNTNGGLYENVLEGAMVAEFDAWLYDASRKAGDYAIVESSSTGAHVMYYVGEGQPMWEVNVRSAMTQERYDTAYKALEESTEIKENKGAIKRVD